MSLVTIKELTRNTDKYGDEIVSVGGWIRTIRDSKSFGFIELNDGSFFKNMQIVFDASEIDNYGQVSKLPGRCF